MRLSAVRGMNDILPAESNRWQALEAAFRDHAERYGFGEVRTPLLEPTALFVKQVGEGTDIVDKEMYSFERHGDALTVRPEGTAGAARAYVEHAVHGHEPVSKWFYFGPMFRGERPAKGRYRQFWQAGCEVYGDPGPTADAEIIELVAAFLRGIGITQFVAHVNTLGSAGARERYRDMLVAHLEPLKDSLSDDSKRRLEKNPLRILDSKHAADQPAIAGAPSILDAIDADDRAHFDAVLAQLDAAEVPYVVDPRLVRGLDYYTRTLFEVRSTTGQLGAQSTLGAGGRYDGMVKSLGGPDTPAIGFAMGIERLLLEAPDTTPPRRALCYVATMSTRGAPASLKLARDVRAAGGCVELDARGGKLKTKLKRASQLGANVCVILGDDELDKGVVSLKDMVGRTQTEVALADAAGAVAALLAKHGVRASASVAEGDAGSAR